MYLADHAWPDLGAYFEAESLALVPVVGGLLTVVSEVGGE